MIIGFAAVTVLVVFDELPHSFMPQGHDGLPLAETEHVFGGRTQVLREARQPRPHGAGEHLQVVVHFAQLPDLRGGVSEVAVGENRLGAPGLDFLQ